MSQRIQNFKSFVLNEYQSNPLEEASLKDKLSSFVNWAKNLTKAIKDGIVKLIPSGLKKGAPMAGVFSPENGDIVNQIRKFYAGTEFEKTNPLSVYESVSESIDEARIPLEYTGEDQSIRNIYAPELKSMVEKLYRSKERGGRAKPIFIYGAPGIGKTEIVGQAAQALGVPLVLIDLQFTTMEDLAGIPKTIDVRQPQFGEEGALLDPGQGITRSNPSQLLPPDNGPDGRGGIIFMDELNRCASEKVFNSIMQFVQKGKLGAYDLPSKWVIVAAGNRPSEADVIEPDFAFSDRFTLVNFVPRLEDWKGWAQTSGYFPPEMISFLDKNEELFHYIDAGKDQKNFPTPRSWTDAARILQDEMIEYGVSSWKDLPIEVVYNVYYDQVGPMAASKLKAYLDIMRKITEQDLEDIIKNPEKAKKIPKGKEFSSVAYGLLGMSLSKAEELSGGEPSISDLFNIMSYFDQYEELEILTWVYNSILSKYPQFSINSPEVLKNKESDDSQMIIKAAKMVKAGAASKGLVS